MATPKKTAHKKGAPKAKPMRKRSHNAAHTDKPLRADKSASARSVDARSNDPCGASARCGACQHIAQPYEQQLARKAAEVRQLFVDAGLVSADKAHTLVQPVVGMDEPYYYRNKVIAPFARGKRLADGKRGARYQILTGMYAANSHRIIDTDGCLIENQQAKQVVREVKRLMGSFGIEPYDEDANVGFLRHVVVRCGHNSGEVLVTLVTNGEAFPSSRAFCRELVRRCPFITTIVQNVNTRQTNVILGEREQRLYGPGFILDTLCGLSFRISSQSFYQVNAIQTEVLYQTAINLAALDGTQDAIDAYCGTGTIGLVAASQGARSVTGVDSVASAIRDARENARHNGIENARFVADDASAFMRELATGREEGAQLQKDNLVVFMDPPRAGSTEEFMDALVALSPARAVYISCNPHTQVRDCAYLQKRGYNVQTVIPVDMFPHTDHIETVCCLNRQK